MQIQWSHLLSGSHLQCLEKQHRMAVSGGAVNCRILVVHTSIT